MQGSGWTEQDKKNENARENATFNATYEVQQLEKKMTKEGKIPDPMEMYKLQKELELCNMGNG
jgi:hypothetical protein